MTWRWTCEKCGQAGEQSEPFDIFNDPAMMHTASHTRGPFDILPKIRIEKTHEPNDPHTSYGNGSGA